MPEQIEPEVQHRQLAAAARHLLGRLELRERIAERDAAMTHRARRDSSRRSSTIGTRGGRTDRARRRPSPRRTTGTADRAASRATSHAPQIDAPVSPARRGNARTAARAGGETPALPRACRRSSRAARGSRRRQPPQRHPRSSDITKPSCSELVLELLDVAVLRGRVAASEIEIGIHHHRRACAPVGASGSGPWKRWAESGCATETAEGSTTGAARTPP